MQIHCQNEKSVNRSSSGSDVCDTVTSHRASLTRWEHREGKGTFGSNSQFLATLHCTGVKLYIMMCSSAELICEMRTFKTRPQFINLEGVQVSRRTLIRARCNGRRSFPGRLWLWCHLPGVTMGSAAPHLTNSHNSHNSHNNQTVPVAQLDPGDLQKFTPLFLRCLMLNVAQCCRLFHCAPLHKRSPNVLCTF